MKMILILLLGIWIQVFSYTYFPSTTFYYDIKIDSDKLTIICDSVVSQKNNVSFCDETGFEYATSIDKTISFILDTGNEIFYLYRNTQQCQGDLGNGFTTIGRPGTHHFSEALNAKFLWLHDLGLFEISKDSLITYIDNAITCMKEKYTACADDIDLSEYYDGLCNSSGTQFSHHGCCSLVDTTTTSFSKAFLQPDIQAFKISTNQLFIQGSKPGTSYSLFDLNGKLLLEGTILHSIIKVPTFPAILKIQNRTLLVK